MVSVAQKDYQFDPTNSVSRTKRDGSEECKLPPLLLAIALMYEPRKNTRLTFPAAIVLPLSARGQPAPIFDKNCLTNFEISSFTIARAQSAISLFYSATYH
jgi:hypothetical protein